jgi:hypothetical protein
VGEDRNNASTLSLFESRTGNAETGLAPNSYRGDHQITKEDGQLHDANWVFLHSLEHSELVTRKDVFTLPCTL